MWLIFALGATLAWGCADLFYKKSTDEDDRTSHLKTAVWVGLVMGAASLVILAAVPGTSVNLRTLLLYSPASLCYIISMVIGYAGLRYLELSIVSPVQNASGALSGIALIIFFVVTGRIGSIGEELDALTIIGTVLICAGVIALAFVENSRARAGLREVSLTESDRRRVTGAKALIFPLAYCLFDTLGTFADGVILDGGSYFGIKAVALELSEWDVLVAYGLTFFAAAVVCYVVLLVRGVRYNPLTDRPRAAAALFEEGGQVLYVFAMAAKPYLAAPLIASYCIVSVVLSRIFLRERLDRRQYITVAAVICGIVLLGISEGISEL